MGALIDLVAAEAVYHDSCFSWLMLNKQLRRCSYCKKSQGRPEDQQMGQYFKQLYQWLDLEGTLGLGIEMDHVRIWVKVAY